MPKDKKVESVKSDYSRREFFRTGATSALTGSLVAGAATSIAEAVNGELVGPTEVPVTLNINGRDYSLKIEPRVTLLDALRNHLDLTGSKRVCDRGTCGACTVLLDGEVVYACSLLAISLQGKKILTVEAVGTSDQMDPVQVAFVENDASQCGFCTPGFIVACKAVLDKCPEISKRDLKKGLGGNLCRCGTYAGIHDALADLIHEEVKDGRV